MRALHTHTSQKVGNLGTIARNDQINQTVQTNGGITKQYQNVQQYRDKLTTNIYSSITQVKFFDPLDKGTLQRLPVHRLDNILEGLFHFSVGMPDVGIQIKQNPFAHHTQKTALNTTGGLACMYIKLSSTCTLHYFRNRALAQQLISAQKQALTH